MVSPIVCPHCGNDGNPDNVHEFVDGTAFRLSERVARTWRFTIDVSGDQPMLLADIDTDDVDWESGDEMRLLCGRCFGEFPLPESMGVDFVAD